MQAIKRGDTGQRIASTLKLNGSPLSLTGRTVSFIMRNRATGETVKRAANITSTTAGTVKYARTAEDVATTGVFLCEWEVQMTPDEVLTFPNDGYQNLEILEDLG